MKGRGSERAARFERELEAAADDQRRGNLTAAIARYRRLLAHHPRAVRLLANLASALRQAGDREGALGYLDAALRQDRAAPELWFNYGNLLRDLGRADEAERAYRRALELDPGLYRAATNLANLLAGLKRADEALELHRQAIAAAPSNLPSLRALARLHYERGEHVEAERRYREAHALAPGHPDTLNALGVVLKDLGRRDEAIACWREVLRRQPAYAAAHNNLGVLLRLMRRPLQAVEHLREAVRLEPRDAMAAANLAHALIDLGQIGEAEGIARAILQREPANAEGHLMLGFALVYEGRVEEAVESFLEAHRFAPQSALVISNTLFASLYSGRRTAADILELHRNLAARIAPAAPPRLAWRNTRKTDRRLKIGYLSPDLRGHPVTTFFEPVLTHHDAQAFEVHCYSTTSAPDAATERLRARAAVWRDCHALTDARLAGQIEEDAIDILVDLAGHTAQNRAPVLRCKPAPVQVLYIGYPGTSGLPETDYLVADRHVCPPGTERFYTERIARLDGSYWCYRPADGAPEPGPPPLARNGYVTFGSFNALQKMSDATVAAWVGILKAVPLAHLMLKSLAFADEGTRRAVQGRFARADIEPARVEVLPPSDNAAFLAEYRRVDVALDPFPYNGGTTSCDALWMGVPLVTFAGERFCARMGLSLLKHVGLPELVAHAAPDYVRIAVELARDPARIAALRDSLRPRMAASPLCDSVRVTRELEDAYRLMWRAWTEKS
jgi:predicted O-linked N-acetylglucosamine transferase (SPINDLY family)